LGKPITIRNRGTNLYLIDCLRGKFVLDSGWPHCLPTLKSQVKTFGLKLADIRYVMMIHAHPDHAGLMQTLKRLCGAQLITHEKDDSVCLVLDEGDAFTGDLPRPDLAIEENGATLKASWNKILHKNYFPATTRVERAKDCFIFSNSAGVVRLLKSLVCFSSTCSKAFFDTSSNVTPSTTNGQLKPIPLHVYLISIFSSWGTMPHDKPAHPGIPKGQHRRCFHMSDDIIILPRNKFFYKFY
jgi:hypothetical protein